MKSKHLELLIASRVYDPDGTVSLTSVLMMVLIIKLAVMPVDWGTAVALFMALANFNAKKWFAVAREAKRVSDQEKLEKLQADVRSLSAAQAIKGLGRG